HLLLDIPEKSNDDIVEFKRELNSGLDDGKYDLMFVSSVRTFVELIVNDLMVLLNENKKENLASNYNIVIGNKNIHQKFIEKISDIADRKGISTIYKELVEKGNASFLISFLNLTTHRGRRLISKGELIANMRFINLLYTFLCFLQGT
ncbi:MAG: hypothetical protein ABF586_12960, partial [Sporolactobacillus sp.]